MITRILTIKTTESDTIQAYKYDSDKISISKRYDDSDTINSMIYLDKNEAKALGEELIKLSEEIK